MYLSEKKKAAFQSFVSRLYSSPLDGLSLLHCFDDICSLMDSDYCSLYFFLPNKGNEPALFANRNPADFLPVYSSVADKDFLLKKLVNTGRQYVLRRNHDSDLRENREFVAAVQGARPISDIIYQPIILGSMLQGFWGLAMAGKGTRSYTDRQMSCFDFIHSFITDAFSRHYAQAPSADKQAYLNGQGRILSAGDGIRDVLGFPLKGKRLLPDGFASGETGFALARAYRNFISDSDSVGSRVFMLSTPSGRLRIRFELMRSSPFATPQPDTPYARLILEDDPAGAPPPKAPARYCLTRREEEVIQGIFRGLSNKAIAKELRIEESTVKRHTHNIYEKTGLRSRVELVTRLYS
jgi:DNA-binding CsgD family transcriptional regulator